MRFLTLSDVIGAALPVAVVIQLVLLSVNGAEGQQGVLQSQPGQPSSQPPGTAQPPQPGASLPQALPAYPQQQGANQWAQSPIVVPPVSFVDINTGRFGKLEVNLQDGQFLDGAVDNLNLVARNMDLGQGQLASLDVEVRGGHFQDFIIDRLTLSTQGALSFDTGVLFNHKTLQFTSPAQAQVTAVVSQNSLNKFLNSPMTLNRLSVTAQKKAALLSNFLGPNANFGLVFTTANLALQRENRVLIAIQTKLGVGDLALPIPLELTTQLSLKEGWVSLGDTRLATGGQEISPELSAAVVSKVNGLSSWGQRSDDIKFSFTDLQVLPGDKFILKGTAQVNRLRFGRS